MADAKIIRLVDFGRDTAEYDKHLAEYFLETPAYERLMSGEKSLIIGRKGTGKTALVKYCSEHEGSREYFVKIEASHSTYVKIDESLRSFVSQVKNLDSSFKLGWLFTTLLALVDRLSRQRTIAVTKDETEVYEFAKQELSYNSEDPISAIAGYVFSWLKNLKSIGPVERQVPASSASEYFDEPRVLHLIRSAVERINDKERTVYLLYDRLDERWDGSPLYVAFLQGLLLAIKDIKATGLRVRPVVFLRTDIFDLITESFQHIDHYRMEIERIAWDEMTLLELIGRRIQKSLERSGVRVTDREAQALWRLVFPKDIAARRAPIPSQAYMIERTLFRPRDIILFASGARDDAITHHHDHVTADDILSAEVTYSRDKLRDLIAEWSYKYARLDELLRHFRRGPIGFDRDELRYKLLELIDGTRALGWVPENEDLLMQLLYSIGFISYTTRGGVLRGTRVVNSAVQPDATTVLEQDRLYVSPIFRRALELRDH